MRASGETSIYAYLLALYLGDGHVSFGPRAQRLRITLDARYPLIIDEACSAIRTISGGKAHLVKHPGCFDASVYSQHWTCVFPQVGPGPKHRRDVSLMPWQRDVVAQAPEALLRGFIHSDGCRVIHSVAGHRYVRYFFSNKSDDIHGIFRDACDLIGVRWTASRRDMTSVAHRDAVAAFDRFIGPKC
jgi:hypothetical protein